MMKSSKRQKQALRALNLDLFSPESLAPPAPATIYARIDAEQRNSTDPGPGPVRESVPTRLPSVEELYRLFDRLNWRYFEGRLPAVKIEYSKRMRSAGSYTPSLRLIRIGRRYHELFPDEVIDTLKHEMIHIRHYRHDAAFRREARRIGASVEARTHPSLQRPPRYVYMCPGCGKEYPRQRRLRMSSCGTCSRGGRYDERFKLRLKYSRAAARRQG